MLYRYIVLLLFSWNGAAAAQDIDPVRFTPLHVGDRWEYELLVQRLPADGSPELPVVTGTLITRVARDTVITGERFLYLVGREMDTSGGVTAAASCLVRVDVDGSISYPDVYPSISYPDIEGACTRSDVFYNRFSLPLRNLDNSPCYEADRMSIPGSIVVGNEHYSVAATVVCGDRGAHNDRWIFFYAADVGLYNWEQTQGQHYTDGTRWTYRLTYASIDGKTYGASTALDADLTAPNSFAVGRPYPNPVLSQFSMIVDGAAAGDAALEVFDVTGRSVIRQRRYLSPERTNLSLDAGALPAGLYLIRVTDSFGRQSGRAFVKW